MYHLRHISLLIFCFGELSIVKWGVKVSYYYCVTVNFSFYVCQHLSYIMQYFFVGAYIFIVIISSSWIDPLIITQCPSLSLFTIFVLKSILSDMCIAIPAFFWSLFAWNIFYQPFIFSLCVSLVLRWVSCRQHMQGSCFCIHSASLVFWLGHSTHLCLR